MVRLHKIHFIFVGTLVGRIHGFVTTSKILRTFEVILEGSKSTTKTFSSSVTCNGPANTTPFVEDNSIDSYSRCLTPKGRSKNGDSRSRLDSDTSRWKKAVKKPFKTIKRVVNGGNKKPGALILVRGGESEYSTGEPNFIGWSDPALTMQGVQQMEHTGRLLLESGFSPDIVYTSRLKRAVKSAWTIIQEMNLPCLPMHKSWRLNERYYGSVEGLSVEESAEIFGADRVQQWTKTVNARPPPISFDDPNYPGNDRKFSDLRREQIPQTESLLDCMRRTEPLWEFIREDIEKGENVMVVAHTNTLRGMANIIDDINVLEVPTITFPNGIPLVYRFDKEMNPLIPLETSLTQVHTSGYFLEKPFLRKEAMDLKIAWSDNDIFQMESSNDSEVTKQMTPMEIALLKLKREQQVWTAVGSQHTSVARSTHKNDKILSSRLINESSSVDNEEENNGISMGNSNENAIYNMNTVDTNKDPVVVLIRHGRTPHNILALFTGWEDVALAEEGVQDARWAGRILKEHGFEFDVVYTSWLFRAIQTAYFVLEEMDQLWLPFIKSWRLNERHYGDLTGKSKKMIANVYGEEQLKKWRKGYKTRPPPVSSYSFNYPGNDKRLSKLVTDLPISFTESFCRSIEDRKLSIHRKFPKSESLFDCMNRSIPFYTEKIVPEAVERGKRVLISSHENAIRGILMHLCEIPEECMNDLHLPNGVPLVYNVKRKCISILDDGTKEYDFGSAAPYLFRPCELEDDE